MKKLKQLTIILLLTIIVPNTGYTQDTFLEIGDEIEVKENDRKQGLQAKYQVKINHSLLTRGESVKLLLQLPNKNVFVSLKPVSPGVIGLKNEQTVWTGPAFREPASRQNSAIGEMFVMQIGDYIQARIAVEDAVYSLRVLANKAGVLEKFAGRVVRDHPKDVPPPIESPSPKIGDNRPDSSCADEAERIDIMVVHTQAAREAASNDIGDQVTSSTAISNEIAFAVGEANMALANSSAFHRYNLVFIDEVNYDEVAEGGASTELLDELGDTNDMVIDEVHGWRDASKADLVSLVTADGQCGWGNTVETADADTTDHRGFTVLRRSCLNTNISLAHETGHNLGALHNIENSGASSLAPPYNHGHFQTVPSDSTVSPWRTVMSYNSDDCENDTPNEICFRRTQFSNPNVNFPMTGGDPTGATDEKDNVRVFAQNDSRVAKYRCSKTNIDEANVWGKDTWADTGLEPDPATAGQSMWRSPYIWVRNSQDVNDEHQHEHENPNISADPHVYVKLHNDGNLSETADLELYFADASTNLNSPSNWTLIGSQSQTMTTGVSVFEFSWSSLPGTGHFCLLARWNNDGSPLSFSTIDSFVRDNKGNIWRNVNIVDMSSDSPDEQTIIARGTELSRQTFLQVETNPFTKRKFPWQEVMKVILQLDPSILDLNLELKNMRQLEPGKFEIPLNNENKIVGPLLLKPQQVAKVSLQIEVDKNLLEKLKAEINDNQNYSITVSQILPEALKLEELDKPQPFPSKLILGGVSYIVKTKTN